MSDSNITKETVLGALVALSKIAAAQAGLRDQAGTTDKDTGLPEEGSPRGILSSYFLNTYHAPDMTKEAASKAFDSIHDAFRAQVGKDAPMHSSWPQFKSKTLAALEKSAAEPEVRKSHQKWSHLVDYILKDATGADVTYAQIGKALSKIKAATRAGRGARDKERAALKVQRATYMAAVDAMLVEARDKIEEYIKSKLRETVEAAPAEEVSEQRTDDAPEGIIEEATAPAEEAAAIATGRERRTS